MKKPKVIELFAGAGGLALGVSKAGFNTIGLVEVDKDCCDTLRNNKKWNVYQEDITELSKKNLCKFFDIEKGELDLLSGGAPCQSFSYAGKRLGLADIRGTLFSHYAEFLKKLKPKMFIFENVKGLLTHDEGKTFKTIIDTFKKAGYHITDDSYQILNAWDYGVCQKRERLIIVGIRKDLKDKISFSFPKKKRKKLVLRDILADCPESLCATYPEKKAIYFELVPPGGCWKDIDPKKAKEYMGKSWYSGGGKTGILRRLSLDEPALTVLTSPGQKQTDRCHPTEVRPFSVRENARCQSFPDNWEFSGSMSSQYRQVGNAVPVELACCVAKEIKRSLNGLQD